jgi:DNA-binding response OmpR family regulator
MSAKILLADDEETFLYSTRDLLRQRGFDCDTAADSEAALRLLREVQYELLISDIRMPGNGGLELVRDIPGIQQELPVIIVTGYPCLESAIDAIQLPVVAYLLKPFEIDELVHYSNTAVARCRLNRMLSDLSRRDQNWADELRLVQHRMEPGHSSNSMTSVSFFVGMTLQNIARSLRDLERLTQALAGGSEAVDPEPCQIMNCPRAKMLEGLLMETVETIERTKGAFKSRELGDLRKRLQAAVTAAGAARTAPSGLC